MDDTERVTVAEAYIDGDDMVNTTINMIKDKLLETVASYCIQRGIMPDTLLEMVNSFLSGKKNKKALEKLLKHYDNRKIDVKDFFTMILATGPTAIRLKLEIDGFSFVTNEPITAKAELVCNTLSSMGTPGSDALN